MIDFLHTFTPGPIIFQIGPLPFRWYGLIMVVGIISGLGVASRFAERYTIVRRQVFYDAAFYSIICGLVGARIYAVFLELPFYLAHPFEIIAVWHGGLAIHGALIGGIVGLMLFRRKHSLVTTIPFLSWTDILVLAVSVGQAIGRWGNYFNQELFGSPTHLPWGIPIATDNRPAEYMAYDFFHPTFLYESILNFINFFVLLILFRSCYRNTMRHIGLVTAAYLCNYGLIRLLMEYFRIDHAPELSGIRWPIIVSVLLVAIGLSMMTMIKKFQPKT